MKGILLTGSTKEIDKELELVQKIISAAGLELEAVNVKDIDVAAGGAGSSILIKGKQTACPDFVLVGFMGDLNSYHEGAVLRMFESLGAVCINSINLIEKTSDKLYTFQLAQQYVPELLIPKTLLVTAEMSAEYIVSQVGLPAVIKIMHGSQGKGISLIKTEEELGNLLSIVFGAPFSEPIIAQQAITSSNGRDIRLIFMNVRIIHSFVRCNDTDFKSNLRQGGYITDFDMPDFLKELSEKLANAMGMKIGSIDYLFGENENEYYLCEANSMPGLTYLFEEQKRGEHRLADIFVNELAAMIKNSAKQNFGGGSLD